MPILSLHSRSGDPKRPSTNSNAGWPPEGNKIVLACLRETINRMAGWLDGFPGVRRPHLFKTQWKIGSYIPSVSRKRLEAACGRATVRTRSEKWDRSVESSTLLNWQRLDESHQYGEERRTSRRRVMMVLLHTATWLFWLSDFNQIFDKANEPHKTTKSILTWNYSTLGFASSPHIHEWTLDWLSMPCQWNTSSITDELSPNPSPVSVYAHLYT